MDSQSVRAVIIGGGQAGARAAKAMRDAGFAGTITLVAAEPHLPYERPLLSKTLLLDAAAPAPTIAALADYERLGVDLRLGCRADAIDCAQRRVVLADGTALPYDRLLLATGGRARRLSIPGYPDDLIFHLRTLDDSRALQPRLGAGIAVTIIGGGFIGLEVAASAGLRGCRVTVVEAAPRLLPRAGSARLSEHVLAHHRRSGVDVRLGVSVDRAHGPRLELTDGTFVDADVVVAGIGISPETSLAEASGLRVDDGILVDEFGRTSDPAILAAGDVTRHFSPALGRHVRLESWQNANAQAEAAARTLAGIPTAHAELPWLWSDQGELNIQIAGSIDAADQVIARGRSLDEGISLFHFRDGRLGGGITINRGREMPLIRRLLEAGSLPCPAEALGDESVPLRRLIKTKEAA